MSQSDFSLIML